MKKLRGVIVGFGRVAAEAHVPGFRQTPGFEIVAVVDPSAEQRAAAEKLGWRAHPDLEAMAAAETRVDFVDVATPPGFHAATAIAALERGAHVLCEKPLATTAAEIADLQRAVRRSGRALFCVHNWKYAPLFRRLRGLLNAGTIGEPTEIEWRVERPDPPSGAGENAWRIDPAAGGGVLMDHGWHAFYLVPYLVARDPRSIRATTESRRGLPVEDTVDCTIDFGAVTARVHLTWAAAERKSSGVVRGPLGAITIEDGALTVEVSGKPAERVAFAPPLSRSSYHPEWFPALLEDFRAEVLHVDRRGRNLAEAVRCAEMMTAAYASKGDPVSLLPPPEPEVAIEGPAAVDEE